METYKKMERKENKNSISLKQHMATNTSRQRNKPTSHDPYIKATTKTRSEFAIKSLVHLLPLHGK